ncbi:ATP-binding protein [Metapseudomonas resinovorans]|uniref:histidine kinase n=1 Tax=Metapseudomonas resinovorans NBRC 106553 TaxID=1245471 RepID=S6BAR8_METRE|nr:transporter substrate-binding domain-containing protein [Pseudomonas resinovorans]BAN46154.1 putative two-component hybrid sensor and regulator [Pseudomonas resinovorans NBRC 106553]
MALLICVVLLVGLFAPRSFAVDRVQSLTLFSQLRVDQAPMVLDEADWRWLRDKGELTMGVIAQDDAPLELIQRDGAFEGIVADVTSLVAQHLGMRVRLLLYPDEPALLAALQAREVDLIIGNGMRGADLPLWRSRPLAPDRLGLFRAFERSDATPADLSGVSIAVPPGYRSLVQERYPAAQLIEALSLNEALSMVAFGDADLMVGGLLPVYYRLNQMFHGLVRFDRPLVDADASTAFILRDDEPVLARAIDTAMAAIGPSWLEEISQRWVGVGAMPVGAALQLSPAEVSWIRQNPVVRLVVEDDMAPLAFFDQHGRFRGLAADLLEMLTLKTGLRFETSSRGGGFAGQIESLRSGQADLAILAPGEGREQHLRFSRPIASTSTVLVGRVDGDARSDLSLENMSGLRIAIGRGYVARDAILAAYPGVELVEAGSALDALNRVVDGGADFALISLQGARYYIPRLFHQQLEIAKVAPMGPTTANFAMRRGDVELQSILDKALASLRPEDLTAITNRWRGAPAMSPQTWRDYDVLIQRVVAGALLAVALVLAWVYLLLRQIRSRKRAERQLADELRFVETLTDSMPPPLFVRDVDGRLLSANRSYLEALGLSLDEVRGRTAPELPAGVFEAAPEFHELYLRAMADGRMIQQVRPIRLRGRECWVDLWIQPFKDAAGDTRGVVCGWLDITEHRHLVDELETAKNLADEASRAKSTFLATMSHEIRTPMNAVIGILELALKRAVDAPIDRASIELAYSSARGLLELIGDILDIARIEAGRLTLAPRRTSLRELVESVARVFDGLARQKGLSLELEIDAGVHGDVLADGMRLKQILANLVSNAIKFTESGHVRLAVAADEAEAGALLVRFAVEDTGIGISVDDQQRLFRPFVQVPRDQQQSVGTGLGLVISRSLCEMMGGRLDLDSAPGRGTRVSVELRLQRLEPLPHEPRVDVAAEAAVRRLRVLVVDDHPVNRQILAQQLGFLGHDVEEAGDGVAALALWRAGHFDALVSDCHMPRMNGADLTRAIRAEERERGLAPTLILGLTADAQPEQVNRAIEAGMDDCLVKPIGLDILAERINQKAAQPLPATPARESVDAGLPGVFDLAPLGPLTGGDPQLVRNLLEELRSTNRRDLAQLDALQQGDDRLALSELSHRLKGAGRVIRASGLIAACEQLEALCRTAAPLDVGVEAVRQAIQELEGALADYLEPAAQ